MNRVYLNENGRGGGYNEGATAGTRIIREGEDKFEGYADNLFLCNISAGTKGYGHGTDLLNAILAFASERGMSVLLVPSAPDLPRLKAWYARFGFVDHQDYMVCTP
jgi:GNAT superfamily N-acetyltransferase